MTSVFNKLRIITLSNVHAVLDWAIDLDDVGALKVYARDLEGAVKQMEQFDNGVQGTIETLQNDSAKAQRLVKNWQLDVDTLLTDDDTANDAQALAIQVDLDATTADLEKMRSKLADKQAEHDNAVKAIGMLNAKLHQVVTRIDELAEAKEETAAMHTGAAAMENVTKVFSDQPSVDDVGKRIMDKNAEARAELRRAMGKASESAKDDTRIASAEAALSRRKAELAAKKQTAAGA